VIIFVITVTKIIKALEATKEELMREKKRESNSTSFTCSERARTLLACFNLRTDGTASLSCSESILDSLTYELEVAIELEC
jgi:hypothetical protein